jgi:hypothetical protein
MFCCFAKQKSTVLSETLVWQREVNRSFSIWLLFRKMFYFSVSRKLSRNKQKGKTEYTVSSKTLVTGVGAGVLFSYRLRCICQEFQEVN